MNPSPAAFYVDSYRQRNDDKPFDPQRFSARHPWRFRAPDFRWTEVRWSGEWKKAGPDAKAGWTYHARALFAMN